MSPEILKTALLGEWVIVTRQTKKEGFSIAHIKYPIPKKTIEQIANDYLIKQLEGYEKGYSYKTGGKDDMIKVTVERIKEE